MVEMLNKLEFMLMGLRQMNIRAVCAWFPHEKQENIIKAIEQSPKFKIEGNIVSLKSDTELYEEELQKDILKDLIDDDKDVDDFSDFDDDLELIEEPVIEEIADIAEIEEEKEEVIPTLDIEEEKVETENLQEWVDAQPIEELEEAVPLDEFNGHADNTEDELVGFDNIEDEDIDFDENNEEVEEVGQMAQVRSIADISGAELNYEDVLRLIDEYNEKIDAELQYASENQFEVRVKAIKTFYKNKYNIKIKEDNLLDTKAQVYALINRKRGVEAAYLLICERLDEEILNYMLDNYDDEVVYFCPIEGADVDFEVGLNEFYLKDTGVIFEKYLEHYVITDEREVDVRKLEIIVGSKM